MRRAVSTVKWNRFALLCFFGFLLVEKVHTNPTKENTLLQEDLPEYYEHHFSADDKLSSLEINDAIKNILMRHLLRHHSEIRDQVAGNSDDSDLSEAFRTQSTNSRNLNDSESRNRKDDVETNENRNRASRNYYGWLDFRKKSFDHEDYLY